MPTPAPYSYPFSRYARRQLDAHPEWHAQLDFDQPVTAARLQQQLAALAEMDEASAKRLLRQVRQQSLLITMERDLAGVADLREVVASITALADVSLQLACAQASAALEQIHGQPIGSDSGQPQQLIIIGMGKLGGGELNVSSDVDLIFAYPEDGETSGPKRLSNHEFFNRLGKRIIALIGETTADGFVFRVDMRLRPYGDAGPLAVSFAMLEEYLVAQGREWERFAWMKARALTGDGEGLRALTYPFVFRKYLDYGAYQAIRELHGQIRSDVARRDRSANIKTGPGGIREIEFIGQIFQLIRGGRDHRLRSLGTLDTLPNLALTQLLPDSVVNELMQDYQFLRRLEHRLQYLDDQQTQTLPAQAEDRLRIAQSMGYTDSNAFCTELTALRGRVSQHFEDVFSIPVVGDNDGLSELWQTTAEERHTRLRELGYREPETIATLLDDVRNSSRLRLLGDSNRRRLEQLLPALLREAARQKHPDITLRRLLTLVETIGRRESYLALLSEYPHTLERLAELYAASPWVSQFLTQHPLLLDELLDTRVWHSPPDWPALARQLHGQMQDLHGDIEAQMNAMREFQHAQVFRLVSADLAGLLPLESVSDHLAALADMVLAEALQQCWADVKTRHCPIPKFAIIAYGKLGAKEIGYASDLDLIFLYDDSHELAQENYAKLAKRLNSWLTTFTRAGILYQVDLRLRPNGASGLLVSNMQAFTQYQLHDAWVWEHQALTRARYCAGDADIGRQFQHVREQVLQQPREAGKLREDVLSMRRRMHDNKPQKEGFFDLKQDPGGLIDLEFAMQYLILLHACEVPGLCANLGNIALLRLAAAMGLLEHDLAEQAGSAYRHLRKAQHALRLDGDERSLLPATELRQERQTVLRLWQAIFGTS